MFTAPILINMPLILMFYLGPAVFQMYEQYEKFQAGYFSGASRPWFIRQGCNHRLATTQPSHQWWNHPEPGVISRMIVVMEWNLSNCSKIYKKKNGDLKEWRAKIFQHICLQIHTPHSNFITFHQILALWTDFFHFSGYYQLSNRDSGYCYFSKRGCRIYQ